MRFLILIIAGLLVIGIVGPTQAAQDQPIIVINPDGSITVKESASGPMIEAVPAQQTPEPVSEKPKKKTSKKEKPVTDIKAVQPEPEPEAEKIVKDAIVSPADPVEEVPASTKKQAAQKQKEIPPLPTRKPLIDRTAPIYKAALTRDDALRIAIDVAPPSRGTRVMEGVFQDRPVYEVIFRTEDGEQSVFVDRETGDIVNPKKSRKKK